MSLKRYDVLTLDDDSKVVVIDSISHEGEEFIFTDEVDETGDDTKQKYRILRVCYEDGTIESVNDSKLLSELAPIFEKNLKMSFNLEKNPIN